MEVFTPNTVSVDCGCGGRHCRTPSILLKHQNTKKHKTWEFQTLCLEFLKAATQKEKVMCLLKLRAVIRTGQVK